MCYENIRDRAGHTLMVPPPEVPRLRGLGLAAPDPSSTTADRKILSHRHDRDRGLLLGMCGCNRMASPGDQSATAKTSGIQAWQEKRARSPKPYVRVGGAYAR